LFDFITEPYVIMGDGFMSKKILIVSIIVLLIAVVVGAGFYVSLVLFNDDMTDSSYKCVETEKDNFVLSPYEIYDSESDMKFNSFVVKSKDSNTEIFSCPDKYRSYDLHSICFAEDSCDIIVSSGDVGDIVYKYEDGIWQKQ